MNELSQKIRAVPAAHRRRALSPRDFWAPVLNPRIRGDFHARSSVFPVRSSIFLARASVLPFAPPPAGEDKVHGNFVKLQPMKLPKLLQNTTKTKNMKQTMNNFMESSWFACLDF
jgi:hypothetical protein